MLRVSLESPIDACSTGTTVHVVVNERAGTIVLPLGKKNLRGSWLRTLTHRPQSRRRERVREEAVYERVRTSIHGGWSGAVAGKRAASGEQRRVAAPVDAGAAAVIAAAITAGSSYDTTGDASAAGHAPADNAGAANRAGAAARHATTPGTGCAAGHHAVATRRCRRIAASRRNPTVGATPGFIRRVRHLVVLPASRAAAATGIRLLRAADRA
jgi:hypothetical protein